MCCILIKLLLSKHMVICGVICYFQNNLRNKCVLEPPTLGFTSLRVTCNNKIIIRYSWVMCNNGLILVKDGDCMPYCSHSRALYHYAAWYNKVPLINAFMCPWHLWHIDVFLGSVLPWIVTHNVVISTLFQILNKCNRSNIN